MKFFGEKYKRLKVCLAASVLLLCLMPLASQAEYYGCLGVIYSGEELADMDDESLKNIHCRIGNLQRITRSRNIGTLQDYRNCETAQNRIRQLLRTSELTCDEGKSP